MTFKPFLSLLLLVIGIVILAQVYFYQVTFAPATSTTTTVLETSSLTCIKIGQDQLENLHVSGTPISFENNMWYIDDVNVGTAVYEDEDFVACGNPEVMNEIYSKAYGE